MRERVSEARACDVCYTTRGERTVEVNGSYINFLLVAPSDRARVECVRTRGEQLDWACVYSLVCLLRV